MRPRLTIARLAALPLAATSAAGAQPVVAPGVGAARVYVDATAALDPARSTIAGAYVPFVAPHWQVGVAPEYSVADQRSGPSFQSYTVAVLANYLVPAGARARLYAGGYLAGSDATRQRHVTGYGGQAGALYFVAPAAALRAEYRYRTIDLPGVRGQHLAVLTLDPYVGGAAGAYARWRPPAFGAVDADFLGGAFFTGRNYYSLRGTFAPFLAPWAQVGVRGSAAYRAEFDGRVPSSGTAFARLYAPLAGRTVPYAEAFGTGAAGVGSADRVEGYGAEGGVRRYVGPNAAFDLGLNWRRAVRYEPFRGAGSYRAPDQTTLRLGVVTHLRSARAR